MNNDEILIDGQRLTDLKLVKLKDECRKRKIKSSGTKALLVERLKQVGLLLESMVVERCETII